MRGKIGGAVHDAAAEFLFKGCKHLCRRLDDVAAAAVENMRGGIPEFVGVENRGKGKPVEIKEQMPPGRNKYAEGLPLLPRRRQGIHNKM